MALFGKKDNKESTPQKTDKKESSTLDLIKETLKEAENQQTEPEMPTEEEIKKAQEILARANHAKNATASNAPINTQNLKALIAQFMQNKSQEMIKPIMACLQNPQTMVCVPAQIITSKENEEKMKQGGQVKLEGPVKINPILLTDNQGKKVFPIFSGEDSIPDDLKKKSPKVNMPFGHCVNLMKNFKDVDTFVLDPYTANIRIGITLNENKQ